jgi:RNA polymerase sigma-70 factor (ECF subfamily)
VAQETMLLAWRHRHRLRDENAGRLWLLKITANLCRDHRRRARHAVSKSGPIPQQQTSHEAASDLHAELNDELRQVRQMMNKLPRRCRDVLYLHAFEQLNHNEIAAVFHTTTNSVRVSLSRARQKMRKLMGHRT